MSSSNIRKKRSFRWMKMLVLVAIFLGLIRIGGQIKQFRALQDQEQVLLADLAAVEAVYDEKQEQIALLNEDAYIERLARERLGMILSGEPVVMTIDPDQEGAAPAPASDQVPLQ